MSHSKLAKVTQKVFWEASRRGRSARTSVCFQNAVGVVFRIDEPCLVEPQWGYPRTRSGILVEDALRPGWDNAYSPWKFAIPPFRRPRANRVIHIPEAVLLRDLFEWNYFHFHFDTLARLNLVHAAGLDHLPILLGPYADELAFPSKVLATGEWARMDWRVQGRDEVFSVDRLHYVRSHPSLADRAAYLRRMAGVGTGSCDREFTRVFLNRGRGATRRITNESDALACLTEHGFTEVDMARLPFEDQVRIASQAQEVVAIHGAGMTNLIYSELPRLRVLELYAATYNTFDFRTIVESSGGSWRGLPGTPGPGAPQNADFAVDVQTLDRTLQDFFATRRIDSEYTTPWP